MKSYEELKEFYTNELSVDLRQLEQKRKQVMAYNASVTDYNNSVQMFPTNIIAGMFSFKEKTLFQIEAIERKNPEVGKLL